MRLVKRGTATVAVEKGDRPLKECIRQFLENHSGQRFEAHIDFGFLFYFSFCPSYGPLPKVWDNQSLKKPALTGVVIRWPARQVSYSALTDNTLNFKLSVKWAAGTIRDESAVEKFEKSLSNCQATQEIEVTVEPPVELISGANYCITVEVAMLLLIYSKSSLPLI